MTRRIEVIAIDGLPRIVAGDDVAGLLSERLAGQVCAGDALVVTHKILSKAQGRAVDPARVVVSREARDLAEATGKDPGLVQIILDESQAILRHRPGLIIARHRLGMVMANAGIDRSNTGDGDRVLLLPRDPDGDAARIRATLLKRLGVDLAVVIADSAGRAWRSGVIGMAVGAAGLPALMDLRGQPDMDGRPLEVTEVALADQIASAAELALGEADEACPAALVRGVRWQGPDRPAKALIRDPAQDLFQ